MQPFDVHLYAQNWVAVAFSVIIGLMAIGGMFAASRLLSSRRHSDIKLSTYECGIPATPYSWSNLNIRFYIFAILFLIFDVEAVFLLPWILVFMEPITMSPWVFYEMVFFIAILLFGIVYSWKKGMLKWK